MYRLSVVTLHDVIPEPPPEPEPTEGLYTEQEITDMINNDDYIPVATADELDALRDTETQTMGDGTIWEGEYLTGLDKKYVQVDDLDLVGYANFDRIGSLNNPFVGKYDGNELLINNITQSVTSDVTFSLFRTANNIDDVELINLRINNAEFTGRSGGVVATTLGGLNTKLKNCIITNAKLTTLANTANGTGGILGSVFTGVDVSDCIFSGEIIAGGSTYVGGIVGGVSETSLNVNINNCNVTNSDITGTNYTGGITGGGDSGPNFVKNCHVSNTTINGGGFVGGIIGRCRLGSGVEDSSFSGTIISTGQAFTGISCCGGIVGQLVSNNSYIKRSYSLGSIEATYSGCGGVSGYASTSGAFIEDSYSHAGVKCNSGSVGGLVGVIQQAGIILRYSYSTGLIESTGSNVGGAVGSNAGTITNVYYDTDTSGQSDTGKGLPRTTEQMQEGTADSFILPAGGEDTGEDAANAMYTGWDIEIWEFEPDTEYPELL